MKNQRPGSDEYASFYQNYVDSIGEGDILVHLEKQNEEYISLLRGIPEDKENFAYAEGKWTIRQLAGHINDAERVFAYRAMAISRGDVNELPGFDENTYVEKGNYDNVPLVDILQEFLLMRKSNLLLYKTFTDSMWIRTGTANQSLVSVRALAFIMAGHVKHHMKILDERYLNF
jgi:hypothetical protein